MKALFSIIVILSTSAPTYAQTRTSSSMTFALVADASSCVSAMNQDPGCKKAIAEDLEQTSNLVGRVMYSDGYNAGLRFGSASDVSVARPNCSTCKLTVATFVLTDSAARACIEPMQKDSDCRRNLLVAGESSDRSPYLPGYLAGFISGFADARLNTRSSPGIVPAGPPAPPAMSTPSVREERRWEPNPREERYFGDNTGGGYLWGPTYGHNGGD